MILTAAWVAPVVGPPIRDGFVRLEGDRIVAVGAQRDLPRDAGRLESLGDAILTPGLVNPHTHLELTAYAGQLVPAPFWEWLPRLVSLRDAPRQVERERQGVFDGAWQSLRAGVTCVGDISRQNLHWRVLRDVPIRKVCFVELLSFAGSPPRDMAELRAAVAEVVEDDLLTVGVSPHAPWSVPAAEIAEAVALAAARGRPWCLHFAETAEEAAFLRGDSAALPPRIRELGRSRGVAPWPGGAAAFVEHISAARHRGLLVHANYLSDADLPAVRAGGHTAIHCPRAHRFFGHAAAPLDRLRAANIPVAIGTDSLASNASLSPLEEAQFVLRERTSRASAAELFRMITLDAAAAVGLERIIGALTPGRRADLAAFALSPAGDDAVRELIERAPPAAAVWVEGRRVV